VNISPALDPDDTWQRWGLNNVTIGTDWGAMPPGDDVSSAAQALNAGVGTCRTGARIPMLAFPSADLSTTRARSHFLDCRTSNARMCSSLCTCSLVVRSLCRP
jgi:hypothetical protein